MCVKCPVKDVCVDQQAFLMVTLEMQHGDERFGEGKERKGISAEDRTRAVQAQLLGWGGEGGKSEAGKGDFL